MRGEKVTKSAEGKTKHFLKDKNQENLAKGGRVGLKFGSRFENQTYKK